MKLYNYFRSSSSYRVRIALGLKGLTCEYVPVNLIQDGGQQLTAAFRAKNPLAQVPVLEIEDEPGRTVLLTQSVAILEYLEERYPEPPLLPRAPLARAQVRRCVEIVNSGVQPLQNLSVLNEVKSLGGDPGAFARRANERGLAALEVEAAAAGGRYLVGDVVTLADVLLVPQLYSARRFGVDTTTFPLLTAIDGRLADLEAFARAHPDKQIDTP